MAHGTHGQLTYSSAELKKVIKFLAFVLRHGPDTIGVAMDTHGWVSVDELIERAANHRPLNRSVVELAVAIDRKKRFALSEDQQRVRAVHGHSVEVDLRLTPVQPPTNLYHSTALFNVGPILTDGLLPIGRNHVHLSADQQTAAAQKRSPNKTVLTIDSAAMAADGHTFQQAENGTWLTGPVPPKYLTVVNR